MGRVRQAGFIMAILLVITGVDVVSGQESSWNHRESFNDPTRVQAVGFSIGEKGYVATGTDGSIYGSLSDLQEFDPTNNTWVNKASLPFPLRGGVAFTIDRSVYITTGGNNNGLNYQLLEWNQGSNTWRTLEPFPSGQGRISAVGISLGTRGYVGTGVTTTGQALNDFWEYDPSGNRWEKKASLPGSGRSYASAFVIHDKIYVGLGSNGAGCLNDWWEFTPFTNTWRRMQDFAGEARTGAMGFSVNGKGYILGGANGAMHPLRDIWEFDPIQNTWTRLDQFPGLSRAYGISFSINNSGYVGAGASSEGYLDDLWECFPGTMVRESIPKDDPFTNPIVVSPNPFFYRFFLKMRHPYTGLLELTVTNMQGQVVFRQTINKEETYIVRCYEIDYLPDGLFIFHVKDPSGAINTRQTIIHKSFGI